MQELCLQFKNTVSILNQALISIDTKYSGLAWIFMITIWKEVIQWKELQLLVNQLDSLFFQYKNARRFKEVKARERFLQNNLKVDLVRSTFMKFGSGKIHFHEIWITQDLIITIT